MGVMCSRKYATSSSSSDLSSGERGVLSCAAMMEMTS